MTQFGTYTMTEDKAQSLAEKVGKLNRKAEKWGLPKVHFQIEKIETVETEWGALVYQTTITLSGDTPVLNGWHFVATVVRLPESDDPMFLVVPGEHVPEEYLHIDQFCDHCKTNRYRRDTYLVRHDDGTIKQVGSNCLADFTGVLDPWKIAEFYQMLGEVALMAETSGGEPGSGQYARFRIGAFLAQVCKVAGQNGWLSKGKAYEENRVEEATAIVAWEEIEELGWTHNRERWEELYPPKWDWQMAAKMMKWFEAEYPDRNALIDNDYLYNLHVALNAGAVIVRSAGIVASLYAVYQRHLREELAKQSATGEWIGTIKERIDLELSVEQVRVIGGDYGETTIIKFVTGDGNLVTWFASGYREEEFPVGKIVKLRGTVRDHNEFNGTKETVLTRCKVL